MTEMKNNIHSIELAEITSLLFSNCNEKEARLAARFSVSSVESRCLRILFQQKELTVNQLAQELSLTSSRITRIVDGLVDKQLVQRSAGEKDRRVFHISLTATGEKLSADLHDAHIKIHTEIINNIPEKYHRTMFELLDKLNEAVEHWLEKN